MTLTPEELGILRMTLTRDDLLTAQCFPGPPELLYCWRGLADALQTSGDPEHTLDRMCLATHTHEARHRRLCILVEKAQVAWSRANDTVPIVGIRVTCRTFYNVFPRVEYKDPNLQWFSELQSNLILAAALDTRHSAMNICAQDTAQILSRLRERDSGHLSRQQRYELALAEIFEAWLDV